MFQRKACKGVTAQPLQESNQNKENLDMSEDENENAAGTASDNIVRLIFIHFA